MESAKSKSNMFDKLTRILDSFLETGIPGFDCMVLHNGSCIFRRMSGYSDAVARTPMNGTERYYIYSASKPITCTAALQLLDKGALRLNDPLCMYMPEFSEMNVRTADGVKKAERQITIRDLFCMTAGFSYNLSSPMLMECRHVTGGRCPTRETMRYLASEPLLFEPGTRWEYSLCHDVLAALVETVAEIRFNEYVRKNIFEPLGMTNSTFSPDESAPDKISPQYRLNRETGCMEAYPVNAFRLGSEYDSGGAGCVSTVEDYARFLEGLRCGKLLRPETVSLMIRNHLTDAQTECYWVNSDGYGLGVSCWNQPGGKCIFGWGGTAGFYPLLVTGAELTFVYAQHVLGTNCDYRNEQMLSFLAELAQSKF